MSQGPAKKTVNVFVAGGAPQFTGGVPYDSMFQASIDTVFHRIEPGFYAVKVGAPANVADTTTTAVELPNLLAVSTYFEISGCSALTSISAPLLGVVSIGLDINTNNLLTEIDLSSLASSAFVNISGVPLLTVINLPLLDGSPATFAGNPLLTSILIPAFTHGQLTTGSNAITSIDLSAFVGDSNSSLAIEGESVLTSVDLSNLESTLFSNTIQGIRVSGCAALTSITLNPTLNSIFLDLDGNFLDQASVDNVLSTLDTANNSGFVPDVITGGSFAVGDVITDTNSGATATLIWVDDIVMAYNNPVGLFTVGDTITNPGGASTTISGFVASVDLSGGNNSGPTGGSFNVNLVSLQAKGWTVTTN